MAMIRRRISPLLVALLGLAVACAALAQDHQPVDLQAFIRQQQALRPDIEAGRGAYGNLSARQRADLLAAQDQIRALGGDHAYLEDLDKDARVGVLNAMASIQALQSQQPQERRICKREKRMGSHRIETVCRTASQLGAEQDEARRSIDRARAGCQSGDGSGATCDGS